MPGTSLIFGKFIRTSAVITMVISLLVMLGWLIHFQPLTYINPSFPVMKFNSAINFVVLALLIFEHLKPKPRLVLQYFFVFFLLLLSGLSLVESLFGIDLYIDQLFLKPNPAENNYQVNPGRMSEITAICFLICTIALWPRKNYRTTWLANTVLLPLVTIISSAAFTGYLFGVPEFYKMYFTTAIAVHSSILFFILSWAIACFNPEIGWIRFLTADGLGNILARKTIPLVVIALLALGSFRLMMARNGWVSQELGIALFTLSFLAVSLTIIGNSSKYLNRIDQLRKDVEDNQQRHLAELEKKFDEKTEFLRESEDKFQRMFAMNPTGMIITDTDTSKILEANQSFSDILGFSREELIGSSSLQLGIVSEEDRRKSIDIIKQVGFLKNHELTVYTKTKEPRVVLMSTEVLELNKTKQLLTTIYDITDRKEMEHKLVEARKVAERSVVLKERFMSNMSHEIRTPLNAIIGFADLLENGPLNFEQKEFVSFVQLSSRNLLTLINDILDYSKIEAGMVRIEKIPFSLRDLFDSLKIIFRENIKSRGLYLQCQVEDRIPDVIVGDPTRLTQILTNLLSNAIKFTEHGGINITAELLSNIDNSLQIRFSISDTGIGIEPEKQKEIFQRFVQASDDTTRLYGGSGLGLAIVKSLIEIQKGTISVSSTPNHGTTFFVSLNFGIEPNPQEPELPNFHQNGETSSFDWTPRVLIMEDNKLNQLLAKKIFTDFGCETDLAENGEIGVSLARDHAYDLIVMDIQMPVMNGYDAAKKLRTELQLETPILAMTAYIMAGEQERCIEAGMNAYISKPFQKMELYRLVKELLNQ